MTSLAQAAGRERPAWLPVAPYAFVLIWSAGYVASFSGQTSAGVMTLLALRYLACLALLAPLVPFLAVVFPRAPRALALIALNGLLIHVLHFAGSWYAMANGMPIGVVALVLSLQPVLTALLAPALAGERTSRRVWIGLGLGLAGTAVVVLSRSEVGGFPAFTLLLVAGGLVAFTLASLLDRRFAGSHHPVAVNLVQFAVAAGVTLPLAIAVEGFDYTLSPVLVASVAYLSIGSSLVGLSLFLVMMRFGEAARVSSLLYLVPPMAAIFGWAIFSQPIPPVLWVGMALASAGVWLAMRPSPAASAVRPGGR